MPSKKPYRLFDPGAAVAGGGADHLRSAGAHTYGRGSSPHADPDLCTDRRAHSDAHAHSDGHSVAHAERQPFTHTYQHAHEYADRHPYTDSHRYAGAYADTAAPDCDPQAQTSDADSQAR